MSGSQRSSSLQRVGHGLGCSVLTGRVGGVTGTPRAPPGHSGGRREQRSCRCANCRGHRLDGRPDGTVIGGVTGCVALATPDASVFGSCRVCNWAVMFPRAAPFGGRAARTAARMPSQRISTGRFRRGSSAPTLCLGCVRVCGCKSRPVAGKTTHVRQLVVAEHGAA
jgi:hypothetical protein